MKMKTFFKKLLGVAEILLEEEPKKKNELPDLPADIEAMYDSFYYDGQMQYGEAQEWKNYLAGNMGCKRKY